MEQNSNASVAGEIDLEVRDLSKVYKDATALDQIDLTVYKGELVSLLGPSGCGKTTLLRAIAGLVDPTKGSIKIKGNEILQVPPHQRNVGFVFQSYALFPHMTVHNNVGFGLKMRGLKHAEIDAAVHRVLDVVKLRDLAHRYPGELSGGQQQRVAIARSIVLNPTLLLLDEPFAALDRALRDHMQMEVKALQRQVGITTLFVTHDQDEALRISDRIAVMNAGRIEQIDSPIELYKRPKTPFVLNFIGKSNVLSGRVLETSTSALLVDIGGHTMQVRPPENARLERGEAIMLSIRPERISATSVRPGPEEMGIPARIEDAVFLGGVTELHLRSAIADHAIVVTGQIDVPSNPEEGSEMWLRWQPSDVLAFANSSADSRRL
jgi:spermidine/putrescine ABC transporter ATP-binding subunit